MSVEIEGRIININPEETRDKITKLGAKQVGFYNFKRLKKERILCDIQKLYDIQI